MILYDITLNIENMNFIRPKNNPIVFKELFGDIINFKMPIKIDLTVFIAIK